MSQKIGFLAEQQARDYLTSQGLAWLESNYRCRMGEIDLIMRDGDYLVFVEVRARRSNSFGGAAASITYSKQQKLLKTASLYLVEKKWQDKLAARFDVLSLDGTPSSITWIKNAFGSNY